MQDDLTCKAGVSQRFNVAARTGGEHQFTDGIGLRAEAEALKHPAILQHQIAFFHGLLLEVDRVTHILHYYDTFFISRQ